MQIKLYEAAEAVRAMLEQIDPETGELPEGFEQARAMVATKAQSCAAWILSNEAEASLVEQHAKTLLDRVKTARKRSEWLREYLRSHMAAAGILSIKSDDGTFSAKLDKDRDESVEIYDERMLPMDFMREIPAKFEPNKADIRRALKEGFGVPGAKLVAKDRLTLK